MTEVLIISAILVLIILLVISALGLLRSMEIEEKSWILGARAFVSCFILSVLIFASFVLRDVIRSGA